MFKRGIAAIAAGVMLAAMAPPAMAAKLLFHATSTLMFIDGPAPGEQQPYLDALGLRGDGTDTLDFSILITSLQNSQPFASFDAEDYSISFNDVVVLTKATAIPVTPDGVSRAFLRVTEEPLNQLRFTIGGFTEILPGEPGSSIGLSLRIPANNTSTGFPGYANLPTTDPVEFEFTIVTPQADTPIGAVDPRITYTLFPDPGDVPEPGAWALMLAGFGATGAALRRRRRMLEAPAKTR